MKMPELRALRRLGFFSAVAFSAASVAVKLAVDSDLSVAAYAVSGSALAAQRALVLGTVAAATAMLGAVSRGIMSTDLSETQMGLEASLREMLHSSATVLQKHHAALQRQAEGTDYSFDSSVVDMIVQRPRGMVVLPVGLGRAITEFAAAARDVALIPLAQLYNAPSYTYVTWSAAQLADAAELATIGFDSATLQVR